MARIRLAHVHLAVAVGGKRTRRIAVARILDVARTHARAERRTRGLGYTRAGRFAPRSTRRCGAGRILVCHLDLPNTHLLQQSRDAASDVEPRVDPEDYRR